MRPGHDDAAFVIAEDVGERLGAMLDWQAELAGALELWCVSGDRAGDDHAVATIEMRGIVANVTRDAVLSQALE